MLADNQEQAFSVASPTAMLSALLRTCGRHRRTAEAGAWEGGQYSIGPTPPDSSLTQVHVYTSVHMHACLLAC